MSRAPHGVVAVAGGVVAGRATGCCAALGRRPRASCARWSGCDRDGGRRARHPRGVGSRCGSRSRGLSSGSWSTSCAAAAAHDGRPPDADPDADAPVPTDTAAWDAFVEANRSGRTSSSRAGRRQGGQRLARPSPARRAGAGLGAQVLLRRPRTAAVGVRVRAARARAGSLGRRGCRRGSRTLARGCARGRGPGQPPARSTRRSSATPAPIAAARSGRRWRPRAGEPATPVQPVSTRSHLAADEAALWGDLRKKWRQYVNKARTGGCGSCDAAPSGSTSSTGSTRRRPRGRAS